MRRAFLGEWWDKRLNGRRFRVNKETTTAKVSKEMVWVEGEEGLKEEISFFFFNGKITATR